ncbi:LysR family transcriptional regulator [Vibrio breoganii]|uniref:LysR family transcriptional regulator n=1 Tax=Vibrio breoganii TaxID=553239 RepID=UPI000C83FB35|nr:LysR family transcriptional regulator [Vibrio breoganii]PMK47391.1 hypothetical protein BCU00_06245 [Vibrio breoganii]
MAKDRFANLDLNLLRTFLILSQELNMRKASARLNVSQPAISQALQKLRHHFDDDLFVKVRTGLEPTSFTTELANAVTPVLDDLAIAVNGNSSFSEKSIDQKLFISMNAMVEVSLGGKLFTSLSASAKNADIEFQSWSSSALDKILEGQTLLGIGFHNNDYKGVYSEKIADLTGMMLVRKGHPLSGRVLSPSELDGSSIASLVSKGWNENRTIAAEILNKHGATVSAGFRSELMLPLINVVGKSDMLLGVSNLFPLCDYPNLEPLHIELPTEDTELPVYVHYHLKNRNNPIIHWLVEHIRNEVSKLESDNQSLLRI